jgi:hypothetical protein
VNADAGDHRPIREIEGERDILSEAVRAVDLRIEPEEAVGLQSHGDRHRMLLGIHQLFRHSRRENIHLLRTTDGAD